MKRAMKTIVFAHGKHYFGEFHTVGKRLKVMTCDTRIAVS